MPITVKELKNIKDNWIFLLQKHEWTMSFYRMVSLLPCCSRSVAVNPTGFWGVSTWPVISNMKFYHFFCKKKDVIYKTLEKLRIFSFKNAFIIIEAGHVHMYVYILCFMFTSVALSPAFFCQWSVLPFNTCFYHLYTQVIFIFPQLIQNVQTNI